MRLPRWIGIFLAAGLGSGWAQDGDPEAELVRRNSALYDSQPDIAHCVAGALSAREKALALDTVNDIRRRHGLAPVTYDERYDSEVMQISLMIVAENKVSHRPLPDWKCFSDAGYEGAQSSNLGQWKFWSPRDFVTTDRDIVRWLTDTSNAVAGNVGHRRWLLDPFLKRIAYGRVSEIVDGRMTFGSALKILYREDYVLAPVMAPAPAARAVTEAQPAAPVRPSGGATFVAYPVGDYPERYFDDNALLSFALVVNPESILSRHGGSFDNRDVDYSAATVSIRERGGDAIVPRALAHDNDWIGLPNNIQFAAPGLKRGVVYDVGIRGVRIGGVMHEYDYWFRIVP